MASLQTMHRGHGFSGRDLTRFPATPSTTVGLTSRIGTAPSTRGGVDDDASAATASTTRTTRFARNLRSAASSVRSSATSAAGTAPDHGTCWDYKTALFFIDNEVVLNDWDDLATAERPVWDSPKRHAHYEDRGSLESRTSHGKPPGFTWHRVWPPSPETAKKQSVHRRHLSSTKSQLIYHRRPGLERRPGTAPFEALGRLQQRQRDAGAVQDRTDVDGLSSWY